MLALTTPTLIPLRARRFATKSVQRWLALLVEPMPLLIEEPRATKVPAPGARTSTPVRSGHWLKTGTAGSAGSSSLAVWSPLPGAETKLDCMVVPCEVPAVTVPAR